MNNEILTFWFNETSPQQWWQKDDEFDDRSNKILAFHSRKSSQGAKLDRGKDFFNNIVHVAKIK
mgnify:CR=1 FL=1